MELNKEVMQAVESLDYRVTVGDVATKAGLNVEVAQQGLLALASETQGHMQVSETGEIAYEFPRNFRGVLRNKYWQLRAQETLSKVWSALFYVIRISFGIMLMVSIAIISIAIIVLVIAASSQGGGNSRDNRRGGGGFVFFPTNFFYLFDFNYGRGRYGRGRGRYPNRGTSRYGGSYSGGRGRSSPSGEKLPFLEAIFSFLFGDGDPNEDLEERRWQAIGSVITNNGGAIAAEQVTPYLDDLGEGSDREYEDYMLPVLTRFNGQPEVSPTGDMVYYFPELQVSAMQRGKAAVSAYLKETKRKFTSATSDQVMISIALGALNLVGALVLWNLLQTATVDIEFIAFVESIYWLLAGYGTAFLGLPLIRYYWMLRQNAKIEKRNEERAIRATTLNRLGAAFQQKLAFAKQFAAQKVLNERDAVYSTETDLAEQGGDPDEADFLRRLNEI
ncbi:hypothetical protein S7335_1992 [Synechococcus sp. PCC 7335]|uniref:hypothetical protein n=1 Tax=Synechococcus sp. (strain ATCC 29403 / PCC 7335) TaxID=91464 RepID=UPI00017EB104|nr:hypothetical protein [Synechococcus sp. PCC 7335]EDX84295.1 hypothetical protein S7335_1992 [Synechococcus sp. PCC 7335]